MEMSTMRNRMNLSNFILIGSLVVVGLGTSSCLKTRAHLRDYSPEENRPVPVRSIQEVNPKDGYALDELKLEMTRLTGRVEDLERSQRDLVEKMNTVDGDLFKKLDSRLQVLEQAEADQATRAKEMESKLEGAISASNPEQVFKKAQTQFHDSNYEGAVETITTYLSLHKIKKPEDATFMKAQSLYKLKRYKKAIVEYSKFPEKYTRSNHMPEALYKIGLSFEALGMKEDARGFFQELVEKYPKSAEAKKAWKKAK